VYTSPILLPLVADLLESFGALDRLEAFVSTNGRRFYRREPEGVHKRQVQLVKSPATVPSEFGSGEDTVVAFKAGTQLSWRLA